MIASTVGPDEILVPLHEIRAGADRAAAQVLVGAGLVVGDLDQVLVPDPAEGLRIDMRQRVGFALLHRDRQQIVREHLPGDVRVRDRCQA